MFLTILKICGVAVVITLTICLIVPMITVTIENVKDGKERKEEKETESGYGWHGGVYNSPPDE